MNCAICGSHIEASLVGYTNLDREPICRRCFEARYVHCYECGEVVDIHRALRYNGEHYCSECYEDVTEELGFNPELLHSNSFKPSPIFYKDPRENTVFMGVELEVEVGDGDKNKIVWDFKNKYVKDEKVMYVKHDGSLDNGFEIVTHPRTLLKHKELDWGSILKWLKNKGCYSYKYDTCGLHVHIDKNVLDKTNWLKVLWFCQNNKKNLRRFAQRKSSKINEWARFWELDEINGFERGDYVCHRHHTNLNFTSQNTVEFRLFRGTLYHKRFMASLQFCDALIEFVKLHSLEDFKNDNNMWNKFIQFSDKDKYRYLYDYLISLENRGE